MVVNQSRKYTEETRDLRRQAEGQLRLSRGGAKLPPSKEEALRIVHELQVHEIELQMQNAQLCQAREELEAANSDLEAFNYTVAHDLRQHLVIINGYCQVILDLHGKNRAEDSQAYFAKVHQGTLTMNQLIDALLTFSSAGKVTQRRQTVDLSAIAKSVMDDLELANSGSHGTFQITPEVLVEGDPDLLRVVLDNLIGNAWRYAGGREGALIEFGKISHKGEEVYFVRDNGPGFDMALAGKLFLPFQRLPGTNSEGHGIGLATVDRIISRHGGRVWAESEKGKGATFFFTLA